MGARAWEPLLRYDELRRALKYGEAFRGFQEPGDIAWPPTYRRRKSKAVLVHDYSDLAQVSHGYTLSVKKRKEGKAFDAKVGGSATSRLGCCWPMLLTSTRAWGCRKSNAPHARRRGRTGC